MFPTILCALARGCCRCAACWPRARVSCSVVPVLVVDQAPGVAHDGAPHRVNPILLLLVAVCDEEQVCLRGGHLEGVRLVDGVLRALDGQAAPDLDDAARDRVWRHDVRFEPKDLPLLEHKPPPAPGLDVLPLLHEPAGALRTVPVLHVAGVRLGAEKSVHSADISPRRPQTRPAGALLPELSATPAISKPLARCSADRKSVSSSNGGWCSCRVRG
mmetsp:Transcript_4058/g.10149  ORF Transcript_4058/g.10149 Transcript_4058/m.10149 type:complete len:216 (+) Transcript_4058:131-778(+)